MCGCIVQNQHWLSDGGGLDFFHYFLEEFPELELVGGPAWHVDWFGEAVANCSKDSDVVGFSVDVNFYGLVFAAPGFRFPNLLAPKTGFIHIDEWMFACYELADHIRKLPSLFVSVGSVFERIAIDDLCMPVFDVARFVKGSQV